MVCKITRVDAKVMDRMSPLIYITKLSADGQYVREVVGFVLS